MLVLAISANDRRVATESLTASYSPQQLSRVTRAHASELDVTELRRPAGPAPHGETSPVSPAKAWPAETVKVKG